MVARNMPLVKPAVMVYRGYSVTLSFFDKLINIVERFLANFVG